MTTPAITTLRSTLATALNNPGVWSVFSFPPAAPQANSVIVSWDDPMITSNNNSHQIISPTAHYKITVVVPLLDNLGNLTVIESFIMQAYKLLVDAGLTFNAPAISAPQQLSLPSGDLLMCDIPLQILTEWN